MKTLYLRNVPEEVSRRLELLAARQGLSVSAFAVRALSEIARRADNPGLLEDLPDVGVAPGDVVDDIAAERARR